MISIDSKGRSLLKNSALYMIANYLGKVLQVLILPIITTYFTIEEYGYYDLIVSSISLIYPIITLQIAEGAFRFIFDADAKSAKETISSSSFLLLISVLFLLVLIELLKVIVPDFTNSYSIYFFIVLYSINSYIQKIARSFGYSKVFAFSGLITVFVTLVLQIYVIYFTDLRVGGLFYSLAISYLCSIIYIIISIKYWKYISLKYINKNILKYLISYSLPLVPNSICWYLVSTGNRYLVVIYLGVAANGIFAISNKFALLIASACGVFQLAWQESAIRENNSQDKTRFFSKVYVNYKRILLGVVALSLPCIKICMPLLVSDDFYEAWIYIPLLLYSSVFMALASFYGAGYLSSKKTSGALWTTIYAAIINLFVTLLLIHHLGLFAPCIGAILAYLALLYIRKRQMKSYFYINTFDKFDKILLVQIVLTVLVYYLTNNLILLLFLFIVNLCCTLHLLRKYLQIKNNK